MIRNIEKDNTDLDSRKVISFAIPCYRSEHTVLPVIEEIISVMKMESAFDFEIVAVVDGSPDNVFKILSDYALNDNRIKIIRLSKNFGQNNARIAALRYSSGDYVVCLDDDGQCPMDHFPEMLSAVVKEYDVVVADYPKKKQSFFKNFGSYINKLTTRILLDVPKNFRFSNFYVMRRFLVNQILEYENPYPFMSGLISQATKNIAYVPMEERERSSGSTGYTLKKLVSLWLNGLTAFSVIPLRISSVMGLVCSMFGFIFGIVTVIRKLFISNIAIGWNSTVAIQLFIGGLIMLMLGIIGEYLGRIYISINNAPQYVVRETVNIKPDI